MACAAAAQASEQGVVRSLDKRFFHCIRLRVKRFHSRGRPVRNERLRTNHPGAASFGGGSGGHVER